MSACLWRQHIAGFFLPDHPAPRALSLRPPCGGPGPPYCAADVCGGMDPPPPLDPPECRNARMHDYRWTLFSTVTATMLSHGHPYKIICTAHDYQCHARQKYASGCRICSPSRTSRGDFPTKGLLIWAALQNGIGYGVAGRDGPDKELATPGLHYIKQLLSAPPMASRRSTEMEILTVSSSSSRHNDIHVRHARPPPLTLRRGVAVL